MHAKRRCRGRSQGRRLLHRARGQQPIWNGPDSQLAFGLRKWVLHSSSRVSWACSMLLLIPGSASDVVVAMDLLHVLLAVGLPLCRVAAIMPQARECARLGRVLVIVVPIQLLLSWPPPIVVPAVLNRALEGSAVSLDMLGQIAESGMMFTARLAGEKTLEVVLSQVGRGVRTDCRRVCQMTTSRYADAPLSPGIGRARRVHIAGAKPY